MDNLKKYWAELAEKYSTDKLLTEQCFQKLAKAYNETHRYYHQTEHINSMLDEIYNCKDNTIDQDTLLFATWFHDVVYNPRKHDNEASSAEIAALELRKLSVPEEIIKKVKGLILATADHTNVQSPGPDTSFFLDCDLKVLGAENRDYLQYAENIRKEYKHVLSFIYKRERKKILKRFITSTTIYRTEYFRNKYEQQARKNISTEIQNL